MNKKQANEGTAPVPAKNMLGTGEAASHLGISVGLLYKLMNGGELPYFKFSTARKLDLADLDAYKAKCRVPARNVAS